MSKWDKIPFLIEELVREAEARGLNPNNTFIQKTLYLLQEALDTDLEMDIYPYLYGPYSPDAALFTDIAEARGLISVEYDPDGYGVHIKAIARNDKPRSIIDNADRDKIKKVVNLLADAKKEKLDPAHPKSEARLWELLASVHYIMSYYETDEPRKVSEKLLRWKPHFENANINKVIELLKELK